VFTRKAATDLSYLACAPAARRAAAPLSAIRHPQRADRRQHRSRWRRRRRIRVPAPARHGRGALRVAAEPNCPTAACRIYAPVGGHRDLLAYLVRRLLENGANSSFVAVVGDRTCRSSDPGTAARRIARLWRRACAIAHSAAARSLRAGAAEFGRRRVRRPRRASNALLAGWRGGDKRCRAHGRSSTACDAGGRAAGALPDRRTAGRDRAEGDAAIAIDGMAAASAGFAAWSRDAVERAAAALERAPI
jgi:RHH-type transcriptional regulator, proline utilization regulon repressor / proline dehydrogenase / delta 1-pyrroline-5-carboxylate dehydrogenase